MTKLIIGGIYMPKTDSLDKIYDGQFGLCMGSDKFCFLIDGTDHIENEVEIACAHNMKLVEGYALAINKRSKRWEIRNSGIKGQDNYVLAFGDYKDGFEKSLERFKKVFHK